MGTISSHILPGILLISIGLWHTVRCLSGYTRSPREYTARSWHPIRGRFKHLELYILLLVLPVFIIYELVSSMDFQNLVKIDVPIYRVVDFQHAVMIFAFWICALITLLSEITLWLPLPQESPFLLASVAFGIEFFIISKESPGSLEGKCNTIFANLAAACTLSAGLLAWKPRAFLADLVLSEAILLQGSWLLQTGMMLYVNRFIPEGCHKLLHLPAGIDGSTRCELEEAKVRAFALVDLAFVCHLILAMLLTSFLCCGLSRRRSLYEPLSTLDLESNNVQMKPMPKQAQF